MKLLEIGFAMSFVGMVVVWLANAVLSDVVIAVGGWQVRAAVVATVLGFSTLLLPVIVIVSLILDWMHKRRQQRTHAN